MAQEPDSNKAKYGLRHMVKVWWYGGESGRQKLRKTTGVYKLEEGFEKPEKPSYHWTALVVRWPVYIVKRHTAAVFIGLVVGIGSGVAVLYIGETWFGSGCTP